MQQTPDLRSRMRQSRTSGSVGAPGGRLPGATRLPKAATRVGSVRCSGGRKPEMGRTPLSRQQQELKMGEAARAAEHRQPRPHPRISISKLGEYMSASASRRRSIIRDQREPAEVKTLHCITARSALTSYLASAAPDPQRLLRTIEALQRQTPQTLWKQREVPLNITALERALKLPPLRFNGATPERPPASRTAISIGGVRVVVQPDLILRDGESGQIVGAVKLYLVKSVPLTDQAADFVTTVLWQFVELAYAAEPDRQRCIFVDVFATKIHTAPQAYKRRMKDLEAACEEIAARWPTA